MATASTFSDIRRLLAAGSLVALVTTLGTPARATAWDLPPPPAPSSSLNLLGGESALIRTWASQGISAAPAGTALVALVPTPFQTGQVPSSSDGYRPGTRLQPSALPSLAGGPDVFGSVALAIGNTPYDTMWRRAAFTDDSAVQGWASAFEPARHGDKVRLLREVNAWVNHRVAFAEDSLNGAPAEVWQSAAESLRRSQGDCEDYALAKLALLAALGFDRDDLYLVIARDLVARGHHAVLAVRTDAGFVILDNATDELVEGHRANDYRPIFSYSARGRWIHGYADRPSPAPIQIAAAVSPLTAP